MARWQGLVHAATVFNNSRIRALFETGTFGNFLLLGDGGYSLRSYFMTPFMTKSFTKFTNSSRTAI